MTIDRRPDLSRMKGYHSAQVEVDVRLNTNESPEPPPAEFAAALARMVTETDFNRYPDREATALRTAIAQFHRVRMDQVFVGNGSNEVLQCLLLAFGGPGRSALVFEPTYALHSHIPEITGTKVLTEHRSDDFTLDPAAVSAAIAAADPTVVFLCSPNNPTGLVEDPAVLDAAVAASQGLVVIDEAYGQFSTWSAVDRVNDDDRLVVVRTFSKTWAMAGLRLGYAIGPASVIEAMYSVALPYHLDVVKQAAGVLAFDYGEAMEARVARIVEQRGRILAALSELDVEVWPSQANFVLFRPRRASGDVVWQRLVDRSVLVRNCASWPGLDGCLRVTVGTADENDRFIIALKEALQ